MRVHDFVDEGLGHSSYLIDVGDGIGAVIDPPRFPSEHEQRATELGLRLTWTADTHSHADYVTGSPALAARTGAAFVAPAASQLATPHHAVEDGDAIQLGDGVGLVAISTPGHTPDHHAYLLAVDGRLSALFTGGSLMVGTVGRTDLCGAAVAEPLAHEMFHSLRRFDDLPDDLAIYPTHGAGSFCSAPGASQRTSTLGHERSTNPLFAITDERQFVQQLLSGFGSFPSYFARLPVLNRLGPRRYDRVPSLAPLPPDDVVRHLERGALVVDARPPRRFGAGHIAGSLANTLRPVFASWLGWLVEAGRPLLFMLDPDQDRRDLVRQCLDVGHEHLLGEVAGGIDAWVGSGRDVETIALVGPADMRGTTVDVRQANEYATGHVPGVRNVELGSVGSAHLPDGPLTVMCGHGERAMTAASLLATVGRRDLSAFDGGPGTWSTATGRALATGR